jgi:hypothetical protein
MALRQLNLPEIARTTVSHCITSADHDASNYYGGERSLRQLLGGDGTPGDLERADPVAFQKLQSPDPHVGRARPLQLGSAPLVS